MATAIKSDTYDLYGSFLTQWSVQIKGTNCNFLFLKVSETVIYINIYMYVYVYIYMFETFWQNNVGSKVKVKGH